MSEKSEVSKRSRQNTDSSTDIHVYIAELEEEIKNIKQDQKIKENENKDLNQDLKTKQVENERLQQHIKELIIIQKTFTEQLCNVQETLQIILTNQNKSKHALESIKNINMKQTEKIKEQLRHQQQQQQQQQQQIKQQL